MRNRSGPMGPVVIRLRGTWSEKVAGDLLSTNPWKTDEASYPRSGSLREQLAYCVNYAVLAPSTHNTQPWLFRPLDSSIEVYADRSRRLPVADPDGRELMISCGAALTNLILAIHRFGHEAWVQYAPEPGNADLIARVRAGRARVPDYQEESLFRGIRRRRSVRRPFQPRPVPRELQRRLIWVASGFGCWIYLAETGSDRNHIAQLVEEAHNRQLLDVAYQTERASWMGSGDPGVRTRNAELSPSECNALGLVDRRNAAGTSGPGERWQERDRELIKASPMLFVIGSGGDTAMDWIRTGEALQHILLRAEIEHVSASFLNQPCQIPDLREQLRQVTGRNGPPQMLVRMGYGSGGEASSRRPVRDVIVEPVAR